MRKITQVAIFLIWLNATTVVVSASGLSADLGVTPTTGSGESLQAATNAAQSIDPSVSVVQSIVSFIVAGFHFMAAVVQAAYAAPAMFTALGLPAWLVTFLFAPLYIIGGAGLIYIITGRGP